MLIVTSFDNIEFITFSKRILHKNVSVDLRSWMTHSPYLPLTKVTRITLLQYRCLSCNWNFLWLCSWFIHQDRWRVNWLARTPPCSKWLFVLDILDHFTPLLVSARLDLFMLCCTASISAHTGQRPMLRIKTCVEQVPSPLNNFRYLLITEVQMSWFLQEQLVSKLFRYGTRITTLVLKFS